MTKPINSLVEMLERQVLLNPHKIAFIYLEDGENIENKITYIQLYQKAQTVAYLLQNEYKLVLNDTALLIYPPGLNFIIGLFGCMMAGVIAVPAYPPATGKLSLKLQNIVLDARPKALLMDQQIKSLLIKLKLLKSTANIPLANKLFKKERTLSDWDFEHMPWVTTDLMPNLPENLLSSFNSKISEICILQYTSGSTGTPKGVMITHQNMLSNLELIFKNALKEITNNDCGGFWLPHYHDMGLIGGILSPIFVGQLTVLMSPLHFIENPLRWLKMISKYKVTISAGPNFGFSYCERKISLEQLQGIDLSSLTLVFNGAEPIHYETLIKFYNKFKDYGFKQDAFYPCYGLAEATLFVSGRKGIKINNNDQGKNPLVSAGFPYQDIKIDTNGEILVHGPSVAKGYWKKENFYQEIDGKKYFRTGDLGFIQEGELFIQGRLKDLIIIRGTNYYPQDIENIVESSHPCIRSGCCAAFSITKDEEEKLCVICEIDQNDTDEQVHEDICQQIQQNIASECDLSVDTICLIPKRSLPKTTSGKIERNSSKLGFQNKTLTFIYTWEFHKDLHEMQNKKIELDNIESVRDYISLEIKKVLGFSQDEILDVHADLKEFGMDSLMVVEFKNRLEQTLNQKISMFDLISQSNIEQLAQFIFKIRN